MKKERWIDAGKCVAIVAVMTDHLRTFLYEDIRISSITWFSVGLFVLLMGVTTYWSYDSSDIKLWTKVTQRVLKISVPYAVAVFLYCCVKDHRFYWNDYWQKLIHFNASGPHYYVLLCIQLLIISPALFAVIMKIEKTAPRGGAWITEIILIAVIAYITRICNMYTDISGIYAGKLLGGSYVLCLYIGMLIGCHYNELTQMKKAVEVLMFVIAISSIIAFVYLIYNNGLILDKKMLLGSDINPPGITLILFALAVLITVCCVDRHVLGKGGEYLNSACDALAWIGRHTLYIFLYHMLLVYCLDLYCSMLSRWMKIPLYYSVMILGSIMIEKLMVIIKRFIVQSYQIPRL